MAIKKTTTGKKSAKKETTNKLSTLASKILGGKTPTKKEAQSLAASVLSQDETKGPRKTK